MRLYACVLMFGGLVPCSGMSLIIDDFTGDALSVVTDNSGVPLVTGANPARSLGNSVFETREFDESVSRDQMFTIAGDGSPARFSLGTGRAIGYVNLVYRTESPVDFLRFGRSSELVVRFSDANFPRRLPPYWVRINGRRIRDEGFVPEEGGGVIRFPFADLSERDELSQVTEFSFSMVRILPRDGVVSPSFGIESISVVPEPSVPSLLMLSAFSLLRRQR